MARVTQQQAHAWVEIYFAGFGWLPFDPTPGIKLTRAARSSDDPEGDSPTPSPSPTATPTPSPRLRRTHRPAPRRPLRPNRTAPPRLSRTRLPIPRPQPRRQATTSRRATRPTGSGRCCFCCSSRFWPR
ncbi:MAG: transglutaminase domain-containing protein [Christensenellales bacterium]